MKGMLKFNKEKGEIIITLEKAEDNLVLSVEDTGIGMSPKYVENLFSIFQKPEKFIVYEYPGLGLGLYVTKIIVSSHNGEIWVKSTKNKGTTIFVSLPLNKKEKNI